MGAVKKVISGIGALGNFGAGVAIIFAALGWILFAAAQIPPLFVAGFALLFAGAGLVLFSWLRQARGQTQASGAARSVTIQTVIGQTFENSTIPLDGIRYVRCTFRNCTFRWHGGAWGGWDSACRFETPPRFETTFPVAIQTVDMLRGLGLLDPHFAQTWSPLTIVAHTPETLPASVSVEAPAPGNHVALIKLRLLREAGIHFLQNRVFEPKGAAIQEWSGHVDTWESMVKRVRAETTGAEIEWDSFETMGNMKHDTIIAEKIDRLETLIGKLDK